MISSTANAQVKRVAALGKKAKFRKETGLFVVEGPRMVGELTKERIEAVYATEKFLSLPENREMIKGLKTEAVTEEVLKAMSDTQSPQGILALARQYEYSLEDVLQAGERGTPLLMILETLQDPGNLGTILRAGEGAGVTGIIMDRDTADIYNPKVIRSTMGSVFRVPFVYVDDLKSTLHLLKARGVRLFAAHLKGQAPYDQADYRGSSGFLIGNEGAGLSEDVAQLADQYVKIPMAGKVESLNAAIAASILMFEAARQRRNEKIS